MQEAPGQSLISIPALKESLRGSINTRMNSDFSASLHAKDARENLSFSCNPIDPGSSSSRRQDGDGWRREHPRELY